MFPHLPKVKIWSKFFALETRFTALIFFLTRYYYIDLMHQFCAFYLFVYIDKCEYNIKFLTYNISWVILLRILNKPVPCHLCLLSTITWNSETEIDIAGFYGFGLNLTICFAGCCQIPVKVELDAEVKVLLIALYHASLECARIRRFFISNSDTVKLITGGSCVNVWHAHQLTIELQNLLILAGSPKIDTIP